MSNRRSRRGLPRRTAARNFSRLTRDRLYRPRHGRIAFEMRASGSLTDVSILISPMCCRKCSSMRGSTSKPSIGFSSTAAYATATRWRSGHWAGSFWEYLPPYWVERPIYWLVSRTTAFAIWLSTML